MSDDVPPGDDKVINIKDAPPPRPKDGRANEPDDPEPDNDDPVIRPASPGRRAQWRLEAFVARMYRDPNFPWPSVEWRRKTLKDENKTQVIDVGDDDNRMAALAFVGLCDLTYDHADGSFKYRRYRPPPTEEILKLPWRSFTDMPEEERASLVRAALLYMESTPQAQLTQAHKWNSAFACLRSAARQVDSIQDEMRALIEKGEQRLKADPSLMRACRPGRLLFNAFPYKPRLRYSEAKFAVLVGRCMMRDMMALALRPAYGRPPLTPQLMITLIDPEEGNGKSSFCRVLGGGAVGDDGDRGRYTDAINVAMIVGSASHGHHTLAGRCAGMTVAGWADKNLGALNETQSGTVKTFINSGVMRWRRMNKDAFQSINWRALNIVTTNNPEVLTQFSGIRRLPIVDLEQWRERRTTSLEVIRQNRNSGLDWLAAHRDVVLALTHRAGDWRGTLAPPDAMLKLMKLNAPDHTRQENWQFIFDGWVNPLEKIIADHPDYVFGFPSFSLAEWANNEFKGRQPSPTAMGLHLGRRGWAKLDRRVRGAPRGQNERMRVLEGAKAKAARESRGENAPIQLTHVLIYSPGSDMTPRAFLLEEVKDYDKPPNLKVVVDNEKKSPPKDVPF
jgi:hypothetical protein